ncbi:ATP-dependent DNA helicase PIF1-like [Helianthus annuus]|uniref:ATP-dependent DNA helicase PIF1-like n=1 Tax=Helianthus annuus TaxID=4232 RepID=UPI000B908194|nr:ATP-dependent DNA helicase PIF1-like [Helianthus annuus]
MARRQSIEAVDRTLQDITGIPLPFGGKTMVMGGDFRKMRLTTNMRAINDPWFSDFLLRVGDGTQPSTDGTYICIPADMTILFTTKEESIKELINAIFLSLRTNVQPTEYITSRAILTTRNETVDEINDHMIDLFQGDAKVYYSFDTADDDKQNLYPTEFLNSLTISGLPPHKLRLKTGCPIILLRNIDPSNGLCNGTRLICKAFAPNVIDAEIAIGDHKGKRVFLPRIPMCLSEDDMLPFKLKRKQFPIRLSFSMTINKSQGQTIPYVGIYLPESVFSHGQLYVALSRGKSRENTKVLVHPDKKFTQLGVYTSNVVYREVLQP